MRITLTLDGDVAKQLRERARFQVKPKACGFRVGVDVLRLNQLQDELEMEDFQRKLAEERRGDDPARF